jgi:CcmD family protein
MAAIGYLLTANIVIWVGVSLYLGFMALQQRRIELRLRQLEYVENEAQDDS